MVYSRKQIWATVVLIAGYIMFQLVADVTAAKIMTIGAISLPAGTLIFALSFTWRDMLHKRLGKEWATAAIFAAAGCNVFMMIYFVLVIRLPAAAFWSNQEAFAMTLGVVPRIAVASIVAELISQLVDTEIYHRLAPLTKGKKQWLRVLASNGVSLPVDSLVFGMLAFAGTMPAVALWGIIVGQIVFKAAVTIVSLPAIYLVQERNRARGNCAGCN